MKPDPDLEARLARLVEHHVRHGEFPPIESVCEGRPDLIDPMKTLAGAYLEVSAALQSVGRPTADGSAGRVEDGRMDGPNAAMRAGDGEADGTSRDESAARGPETELAFPRIDGFRTIESLGRGGMGEVFKLHDLKLDRTVAAKVIRKDRAALEGFRDFLNEARTMALFQDNRIVQIHEFRDEANPAVLIMEFVDGFELGRIASSLEFKQRARIIEQVAEAIHRAHRLGIQHRDLKPSNIMLDAALTPKILDFGLSAGDPTRGHLRGTLPYLAPEQLDPAQPIDARTDVYALGVILYELLCGEAPFGGAGEEQLIRAIRQGQPRLPVEIEPATPEPLQAIALKAMERDPASRYQSAQDLAHDLRRYLDGLPVLARPAVYASALDTRIRSHLDHIGEWLRLRLIYPHEASHLRAAYRDLEARDDDWIVSARSLSYSQIALYLGAFLLVAGALFYFGAYRLHAFRGIARPFLVLGVPFLGLNAAANYLYRREHRAVAVAFYLGGVALLPLFLMILLHEQDLLGAASATGQFFTDGSLSNRQLQVTILAASAWACFLAFRTRTIALSTVFSVLLFLLTLAVLSDFGLRDWLMGDLLRLDRLALHLVPLVFAYAALGYLQERSGHPWFGRPLYVAGVLTLVTVLELLAWDRREMQYLGLTMTWVQGQQGIVLLDTMTAMTLNGVAMYAIALGIERRGSDVMKRAGGLLFMLSPFAALKPLGYLCWDGHYSHRFDWVYLVLAVGCCLLSHHRQRRSFYYAGLINAGWALYVIADHNGWRDKPPWAMALVAAGLLALAVGYALSLREGTRLEIK